MAEVTINDVETTDFLSKIPEDKREAFKEVLTLLAEIKVISETNNFNYIAFVDPKYKGIGYVVVEALTKEMNDTSDMASIIPLIMRKICDVHLSKKEQYGLVQLVEKYMQSVSDEDNQCDCPACTVERKARELTTTMH